MLRRCKTPQQFASADLLLLEGLVDPSGGDVLQQVYLELLPAGEDAEGEGGEVQAPAMMAKLTGHLWTLAERIKRPAVQFA
jgi:hypothetical protein